MQIRCPGCGETRDLGPDVQVGAMVSCASCAGVLFRLVQRDGHYVLQEVPQASCPQCETLVHLPEGIQVGARVRHCERTFAVTYAYGAYALEPADAGEELTTSARR